MTTRSYCNQALLEAGLPVEPPNTLAMLTSTPLTRTLVEQGLVQIDGETVRSLRLTKTPFKWTQPYLAARAGVHSQTISNIERGYRTVYQRDTARRIADALGVDLDDILADSLADAA